MSSSSSNFYFHDDHWENDILTYFCENIKMLSNIFLSKPKNNILIYKFIGKVIYKNIK